MRIFFCRSQLIIDPLDPLFSNTIVLIKELSFLLGLSILKGAADVLKTLPGLIKSVRVTEPGPVLKARPDHTPRLAGDDGQQDLDLRRGSVIIWAPCQVWAGWWKLDYCFWFRNPLEV